MNIHKLRTKFLDQLRRINFQYFQCLTLKEMESCICNVLQMLGIFVVFSPWHTFVSSCEQWLHTWPCQSCTCVQFQGQEGHQGWGLSTESIWITAPETQVHFNEHDYSIENRQYEQKSQKIKYPPYQNKLYILLPAFTRPQGCS